MKASIAGLLLALFATTNTALAGDGPWFDDFDEAVAAAKEQKKDLFVDFTGSDWCGWCIRLHKEVFDHDEFLAAAQDKYILVALDFPSGEEAKAKVPNPERNEELKEKYSIRGFPTILLMNPDGAVFAQTGYQKGGPEKYVTHMAEIAESGKRELAAVTKLLSAFESAEGESKVAAWEDIIDGIEELEEGSPFVDKLATAVSWALKHDADNSKGLKLQAVNTLLEVGIFNDEIYKAGVELDPENKSGLYERVVDGRFSNVFDDETARAAVSALASLTKLGFRDKKLGFQMNFNAALWSNGPLEDPEAAKRYAGVALSIGSENEEQITALKEIVGT